MQSILSLSDLRLPLNFHLTSYVRIIVFVRSANQAERYREEI